MNREYAQPLDLSPTGPRLAISAGPGEGERMQPEGFEYAERGGEVVISHRGRRATTLRAARAAAFLTEVEALNAPAQQQLLMARLTGNYRRGNERRARQHPRNA